MTEDDQTSMAIAALFGALVRSLGEMNPGIQAKFCRQLEETHSSMEGYDPRPDKALETLTLTHDHVNVPLERKRTHEQVQADIGADRSHFSLSPRMKIRCPGGRFFLSRATENGPCNRACRCRNSVP
jgi:hypothetical protein